ncbi:MAG TPA: FAD-dependent oxidoreductase [Solirubrobacteraceae bacterium]|jgi:sulfide:quinone oxidoreductase
MSRIIVAGGGVAALESCLALRAHLGPEDLEITLLTPSTRFEYRPLAVLESFEGISRWSLALSTFGSDLHVDLVHDALAAVGPHARVAVTGSGTELGYDLLLVATGGHTADAIHGAITFRGPAEGRQLRALLDDPPSSIVFAAPAGASWPLPLYELALMSAADLRSRGADTTVALVTPEQTPLAAFGASASESTAAEIADREIELITGADPVVARDGALELRDGRHIEAECVIALPRLFGRRIEGIPHDAEDFIVVDEHCRVVGLSHVYAAGDVTNLPFKHGGLAAQQGDAAAEAMLAQLGVAITPEPLQPVLEGVLFADRRSSSTWPPEKIVGRHLTPYLAGVIAAPAPRKPTDGARHQRA